MKIVVKDITRQKLRKRRKTCKKMKNNTKDVTRRQNVVKDMRLK